jgi:hypothetical protein
MEKKINKQLLKMSNKRKLTVQQQAPDDVAKAETIEELQQKIIAKKAEQLALAENAIEELSVKYNVTVGIKLDLNRMKDVLSWMIENGKDTISLKYEVWL